MKFLSRMIALRATATGPRSLPRRATGERRPGHRRVRSRRTRSKSGDDSDSGSSEPPGDTPARRDPLAIFTCALADLGVAPADRLAAFYALPEDAQARAWTALAAAAVEGRR